MSDDNDSITTGKASFQKPKEDDAFLRDVQNITQRYLTRPHADLLDKLHHAEETIETLRAKLEAQGARRVQTISDESKQSVAIKDALLEWCRAAGWADQDESDRLFDRFGVLSLIQWMKSTHCEERSWNDLRASGGIFPEFYAQANDRFRSVACKIASELDQLANELRNVTTPSREA